MVAHDSPRDAATAEAATNRPALSPERAARRAALMAVLEELEPIPDGPDAMQFWSIGTYLAFKPQNGWHDWLSQHVACIMMRINRAERVERKLQALQSLRAIDCWEVDRRLQAEQTALQLVRHPDQTHGKLLDSLAGCDWLIGRWEELARTPADRWTAAQRTLAALIHPGGADAELAAGFAERRLAILRDRRDRLAPADEALRALVEAGLSSEMSPALKQHRRDVRAWQRQLRWYVEQLRTATPDRPDIPLFRPIYDAPAVDPAPGTATDQNNQTKPNPHPVAEVAVSQSTQTKPNIATAAESAAPENTQTKPTEPDPAPADLPETEFRQHLADPSDAGKAARVAERKRRIDPERAVAQLRRDRRRSA